MADDRIAAWTRWIEGSIRNDVLTMHLQRAAWRDVARILDAHGDLPDSYWWEFMRDTYAVTQAVAVRRQVDIRSDVASLGKLIQMIGINPSLITHEFWIGLCDSDPWNRQQAELHWTGEYAGAVGDHVDPEIPRSDFNTLRVAAEDVKRYVNDHVAHAKAAPVESVTVTLGDLHDVIDVVGRLFTKYSALLTAHLHPPEPIIPENWKAIFLQPWVRQRPD